jgi:hypothetical protein
MGIFVFEMVISVRGCFLKERTMALADILNSMGLFTSWMELYQDKKNTTRLSMVILP